LRNRQWINDGQQAGKKERGVAMISQLLDTSKDAFVSSSAGVSQTVTVIDVRGAINAH
jgi:hypothetical protein